MAGFTAVEFRAHVVDSEKRASTQPDPPRNERGTRSGTGLGRRAQCSSGHGRTPNEYRKEEFGTVLGMVTHHHHTHASKEYRARRFGCIAPYHSTIPEHRTRALSVPDVT
eukprot:3830688-Rhodomonas_salina.1